LPDGIELRDSSFSLGKRPCGRTPVPIDVAAGRNTI
jgi:hypothetical protein